MIKVLEKHVADRIAAGEVVDRPLSVVKELVENSIDAGATSIVVEIRNGGKTYIRVTDNGCGINAEETEIAFARHATSKIVTDRDLESIETLGFRGEALASIASVSRVELLTKTREAAAGTRVILHGGDVIENGPYGCPDGTSMIVSDLFYNTPARLKFMKSDNTESSLIIDFVSQIALAYPEIRIRMVNNGNILFSTIGKGILYDSILTVYSKSVGQDLVSVDYRDGYLHLYGYVSAPMNNRTSRKNQIFFVNGRVVSSKVIERGVNQAYSDRMFEGRFPICFLFLEVAPDKLDVNIHPNKRDVRFNDEAFISDSVARAIRQALDSKTAMAQVHAEIHETAPVEKSVNLFKQTENMPKVSAKQEQVNIKNILSTRRAETEKKEAEVEKIVQPEVAIKVPAASAPAETVKAAVSAPVLKENVPFRFEDLKPIGSVFATYILCSDDDTFYLIDQHAAHERVFFEKLLREFKSSAKQTQPSLIPIVLNVRPALSARADEWMQVISDMGFDISEFGPNTYKITAVPMFMDLSEAEDFINDFLEHLDDNMDFTDYGRLNKIISKSCKSAVKGNDQLHDVEIRGLLNELAKCENPYSCPHGRPTFVRFTKYELEKFFKRIQ